jgi:hypothetical protein
MPESDQTATSNDPKHQERDDPRFSPGAGCIIIILALSLFTGAIFYAIWAGIRQDRDIAKFTTDQRMELPDEPGTPEQVAAVRAKLDGFKKTIRESKPASLELNVADLNILVRNETALIEIREMVYFEAITAGEITGRIAMPLRRLAFWKPCFLNGTFTMKVEAAPGQLFLRLEELNVPGKEIPPGFIERIAQDDLLNPYKNDDNEDIYLTIQSATSMDGSVTIESKPVEKNE